MSESTDDIIRQIRALERQLEGELAKQRAGLRFGLEYGRVAFEEEALRRHREVRRGLASYLLTARPLVMLTAPVIYSLIIPFALVDIMVSIYQAICFRVYDIPQVKRGRYLIFDRAALNYLNALEKVNCAYCSYINGIIAYVREVAACTEQYWCPIKHARRALGAHPRYAAFEDYGDGEDFQTRRHKLRAALRDEQDDSGAS